PDGKKAAIEAIRGQLAKFEKGGEMETMFPHRWLPSTFAVLPEPFTEQNGMVNSTMKIVRGKVEKAYAERIEHMYTPEGKNIMNEMNINSL
ncbi:MAG: long-chain fatty acid--CoA ligase, partial [Bacteroidales bacterium]|nr:long-chain fatty acid--CoA ligase [Bacteroidales bacterium]